MPTGQPGPDREGWPKGSKDPLDPDLVNPELLWPKLLTAEERATAAAVCDVIIPADERSPAASAVGVHDFVDEWVSAPYPRQKEDRQTIRGGLAWINTEADKRFGRRFAELAAAAEDRHLRRHRLRRDRPAPLQGGGAVLRSHAPPDGDGLLHHGRGHEGPRLRGQHAGRRVEGPLGRRVEAARVALSRPVRSRAARHRWRVALALACAACDGEHRRPAPGLDGGRAGAGRRLRAGVLRVRERPARAGRDLRAGAGAGAPGRSR